MTARINRYLLEQTRHDSADLVQPDFVVHPCTTTDAHQLDLYRYGKLITSVMVEVDPDCPDQQLSIDLASLEKPAKKDDCCCEDKAGPYRVGKDGYVLFYVGSGAGGFSVKMNALDNQQDSASFDSQHLYQGDLFGTTLLRPGQYQLVIHDADIALPLFVEAIKPGKTPYRPPDALHLEIAELRQRKELRLQQAQGIVIRAEKANRIVISFADQDTSEPKPAQPIARMTRAGRRR